jgi:hypothetical protein
MFPGIIEILRNGHLVLLVHGSVFNGFAKQPWAILDSAQGNARQKGKGCELGSYRKCPLERRGGVVLRTACRRISSKEKELTLEFYLTSGNVLYK